MQNDFYRPDDSREHAGATATQMLSPDSGPLGVLRLPGIPTQTAGAEGTRATPPSPMLSRVVSAPSLASREAERDKVLPLPGWLTKLYFVFPVVLYVPDVIFNYYVYSDGVQPKGNMALQIASYVLWGFLSVGVVGMAYLLSVLAPWHWGQGHRIQAFFCGLGVVIATAITTWNSLAYRSEGFVSFHTDDWAYAIWPQLQVNNVSITMILVAVAPPFWGLFWAIVQPTETGRSLRQLQESHEERLLRMQQEAELKRLKAETNAKVREAQLRGMAATAAAARQQAAQLLNQKHDGESAGGEESGVRDTRTSTPSSPIHADEAAQRASDEVTGPAAEAATAARPQQLDSAIAIPQLITGDRESADGAGTISTKKVARGETRPVPGTRAFERRLKEVVQDMRTRRVPVTLEGVASEMNYSPDEVGPTYEKVRGQA